jgi:LysR family glycine cleavage system transcriptional activator
MVTPRRIPLRSMSAFEAAARLGSFQAAARELHLTPSAISHQIRRLEAECGTRLFQRTGRGVTVSPEGAAYAQAVAQGFRLLQDATDTLARTAQRRIVRIATPPSLARSWLLPRLPHFMAAHPGLEIQVNGEARQTENQADLRIVFGDAARWQGQAHPLLRETILPLCAPALLAGHALTAPRDLLAQPLIATIDNAITWDEWFRLSGINPTGPLPRPAQFDPSHLAIDAALQGMGVVLESTLLTETERHAGRLVAPFPHLGITRVSYWLLPADPVALSPAALTAYQWLQNCAETSNG